MFEAIGTSIMVVSTKQAHKDIPYADRLSSRAAAGFYFAIASNDVSTCLARSPRTGARAASVVSAGAPLTATGTLEDIS